jgi:transcription elongation factor GreB
MNKAFTKETDDAPQPIPEDRPVSSALNLVTPRGAQLIKDQINAIENKHATEADPFIRSELRRDLRYWLARQSSMQIVAPIRGNDIVVFGSRVTVQRGASVLAITIVGEDEADPKAGLISWTAPLARAIDGAKVGETLDLEGWIGENGHHSRNIK